MPESATLKVSDDGEEQIVRLPKAFRLSGREVRVSRSGQGLRLEPVEPGMSADDIRAILDELEKYKHVPFMPNGREHPPMPDDDDLLSSFD